MLILPHEMNLGVLLVNFIKIPKTGGFRHLDIEVLHSSVISSLSDCLLPIRIPHRRCRPPRLPGAVVLCWLTVTG